MQITHISNRNHGVAQMSHFCPAVAGVISEVSDISGFRLSPRWPYPFLIHLCQPSKKQRKR